MKGSGNQIGPNPSVATPIEDCAADWVAIRRNPKDWNAALQAELDAWLAQSLAHRVAYIRIDATWRRTARVVALRRPMRNAVHRGIPRSLLWTRIAIVLGLVMLTSVFVENYLSKSRPQLIETPKGGQERLTLSDGSQVELNTDTAVLVDFSTHSRAVELVRGEAYFQVKHDAMRPFIVTVATHRIVDLGTKFLVRMTQKFVKVELVEGSALLESIGGRSSQHALTLKSGDVAVASAEATRLSRKSARDLSESLAWQRGSVVFHNERLVDAVADLNRYGGPQLVIADVKTENLMINGTFLTNKPEDFAGITHEIFGLHVEQRNGNLILSH